MAGSFALRPLSLPNTFCKQLMLPAQPEKQTPALCNLVSLLWLCRGYWSLCGKHEQGRKKTLLLLGGSS